MKTRGTSNTNSRGSSYSRRRRKEWMLQQFGDGATAPCSHCGVALTFETITADRVVPGSAGGTYKRGNIRPACGPCNSRDGSLRCRPDRNPGGEGIPTGAVSLVVMVAEPKHCKSWIPKSGGDVYSVEAVS